MFLLIIIYALFFEMTAASHVETSTGPNSFLFATELFHGSCRERPEENVIISPISINIALGLLHLASGNKTEEELRKGLRLGDSLNRQQIAENFAKLLQTASKGSAQVQIANKIYVKEGNKIAPSFNDAATKYFGSEAEQVNFTDSRKTLGIINTWVESKTNNKIKNILTSIEEDTQLLLVNAIYFMGLWENPFDIQSTQKLPFYYSLTNVLEVDTMYSDDNFKYAEISKLDATILELPYKGSKLSMIFILPNKKDGLTDLQQKLNNIDMRKILDNLTVKSVEVFLPRFQIEFDLSLNSVLSAMGMETMFSDKADFCGLFENIIPIKVDNVQHKAYIKVNEAGSEATAATIVKISLMSYNPDKAVFRADHPFIFLLKDEFSVYFAGRVISFQQI